MLTTTVLRHWTRRPALLCAAALVCAAALPAVAQATTVSRINTEGGVTIFIQDTAGVDDALSVLTRTSDDSILVNSDSLEITAVSGTTGSDCTQINSRSVRCPVAPNLLAELGDGADQLSDATSLFATLNGGPGADRLTAGFGVTNINGGAGNDVLSTGSNVSNVGAASNIGGDDGNDVIDLSSRTATGDIARGGGGTDTVTYARRTGSAVLVTLDGAANDGGSGETDDVRSDVENVTGGGANDILNGSAGANTLRGGPGNDILIGEGGNDTLLGDAGNDAENGGDGDDRLGATAAFRAVVPATEDTGADSFRGGDGTDRLFTADGTADTRIDCGPPTPVEFGLEQAIIDLPDPQPVACEEVDRAAKDQHPTVQVRGGRVRVTTEGVARVRLSCPRAAPGRGCRGVATLVKGRRTLARSRYSLRRGSSRRIAFRLTQPARGVALIRTTERDTRGRPEETLTRVVLRG